MYSEDTEEPTSRPMSANGYTPINSVPPMSRQPTAPEPTSEVVSAPKRAIDEVEDDFDEDDEAAMLALADAEVGETNASAISALAAPPTTRPVRQEPALSEGIAAALAKLRQPG
jgi:hypothetical protein